MKESLGDLKATLSADLWQFGLRTPEIIQCLKWVLALKGLVIMAPVSGRVILGSNSDKYHLHVHPLMETVFSGGSSLFQQDNTLSSRC